jgi:hypothetical protein
LNRFQSFVLHGTVAGVITCPNNPRCIPVPVNVWRIETSYKRAPGDISHTDTRCNPMETMYRNKTPQSTPLKNTHGIRPLLGRCDDPNHRWWTGAKRPRFTFLAFVAALTKVCPPMCILTDRIFHPVFKDVPDSNLVYPLSSIPCLPSPATRSGRHRDFDRACPGKKRDHRVQTRSNRRRTAKRRETSHTPTPSTPFKTHCAPFPRCHRLPWPHLPGGRATVPGHSEPLVDPPKGPHAT